MIDLNLPKKPISWLKANIVKANLAEDLNVDTLGLIGQEICSGYDTDLSSRTEWEERIEEGLKGAMQMAETKTFPWDGCANVKFPLIATAAIQFASRAYSEIIRGRDIVHAAVIGEDPDGSGEARAKRVGDHMSYQLIDEMPEWEPDTDLMLHVLPIVGSHFRKSYYDPLYQRNMSEGVLAEHLVVNYKARSLETTRRYTHKLLRYRNEALEKERFGQWLDSADGDYSKNGDKEELELFLEQYCWLDLDGDGYEEPYTVVVHHSTQKVKRITARYEEGGITESPRKKGQVAKIDAVQYFTHFIFIPSPDGGFYGMGFAQLLGPINETMNGLLNQLLDAGTLSNMQSGFISDGIRIRGGNYSFRPGEWKVASSRGATLKDGLVPLPAREPSGVLFQLLGFLNENALKLASVSETMSGETPGANVPATTVLALIEQGLKVFTSIYKRIFRSLKAEYKKLYDLNAVYLPENSYYRVLNDPRAIARQDYVLKDCRVEPVADPTQASEALRLAKARALMEIFPQMPLPEQKVEILRRYCEALSVTNIHKLFPMDKINAQLNAPPPPNPDLLRIQLDTHKAQDAAQQKNMELQIRFEQVAAQIEQALAQAQLSIAQANAADVSHAFDVRTLELNRMMHDFRVEVATAMAEKPAGPQPGDPATPSALPQPNAAPGEAPAHMPNSAPATPGVGIQQPTIGPNESRPDSDTTTAPRGPGRPVVLPGETQ